MVSPGGPRRKRYTEGADGALGWGARGGRGKGGTGRGGGGFGVAKESRDGDNVGRDCFRSSQKEADEEGCRVNSTERPHMLQNLG